MTSEATMGEAIDFDLPEHNQLTFETLRIGMSRIDTEDYVDESGASRHGVRTGLWLYFRDEPDQDCAVRVHSGQSLDVAGYRIEVLGINPEQPGTVQLRLSHPARQASAV